MYCQRYEPENYWAVLGVVSLLPILPAYLLSSYFTSSSHCLFLASVVFLCSLFTSIILYRLSPLHPLAKYPGPPLWRITKFSAAWYGAQGRYHIKLKALHDRYGHIVRIGPNELSIIEKDMIPFILGPKGMPKGPLWEGRRLLPSKNYNVNNSLIGVRDLQRHSVLRRPWNKAFGTGPLKDYEEMLLARGNFLQTKLEQRCESSERGTARIDLTEWMSFFAFDFMGDIAFSSDFSLLDIGDLRRFVGDMAAAQWLPTILQHVPWLAKLARATPFLGGTLRKFGDFAVEQARRRAANPTLKKDLFHHLLQAADPDSTSNPLPFIISNAVLTILAGSDTTSSALSSTFYYLLRNPGTYKQLQGEIDDSCEGDEIPSPDRLAQLPHLNAVINEALRMQPPVPTSIQRAPMRGSGGRMLGSMFIPEGTNVQVPPYAIHRDPRYFSPNPDSFWPDRWLQRGPLLPLNEERIASDRETNGSDIKGVEVVTERDAFIPFATGPTGCVGKPLAMMELRYVVALLVKKFEMRFSDGFKAEEWEAGLTDRLTLFRGPLYVDSTRRQS
ncbi:high nitrogen upregulated cytochrome P450 monooxygenase 2 [Ephemerocybe angulata]|uniref:High nitrogen upregulated cytochrome P450 monooxygenase 2 n=1 Tax=Ephemerocybe angulata TaxID=980116 RepID=A0A8H6M0B1_9AGAR|nr:high nitrogen upregulated cytochrome P450 monooxygenase 2 [Tulosesus angulatus]